MFGRTRERRTQTYTTSDWDDGGDGPPKNPVVAVRVLPSGPVYVLDDICDEYGPKKRLSIGSSSLSDIRLRERLKKGQRPTVSRDHCQLVRTPQGRVLVRRCENARNGTKVNRVRVHKGMVELGPGDVLRAGRVEIVALGAGDGDRIKITADDPQDYLERVVKSRGNVRKAAPLFGKHASTVARWLKQGKR